MPVEQARDADPPRMLELQIECGSRGHSEAAQPARVRGEVIGVGGAEVIVGRAKTGSASATACSASSSASSGRYDKRNDILAMCPCIRSASLLLASSSSITRNLSLARPGEELEHHQLAEQRRGAAAGRRRAAARRRGEAG